MNLINKIKCYLIGHDEGIIKRIWLKNDSKPKISKTQQRWLNELELELRKDNIPIGWYPFFVSECKCCGKSTVSIDTLYEAIKGMYPEFNEANIIKTPNGYEIRE